MSSGFDAIGTGLLGSINQGYTDQRKAQVYGDESQVGAFREAQKEYDDTKAKNTDLTNKIDTYSNILNAPDAETGIDPDVVKKVRSATARDAVQLGLTGAEHFPIAQHAYRMTLQDAAANPDKWASSAPAQGGNDAVDSNPANTAILHKYDVGKDLTPQQLEDIRTRNVAKPYGYLPGASWGDMQNFMDKQVAQKSKLEAVAKQEAADSPEALKVANDKARNAVNGNLAAYGYTLGPDGTPVKEDILPSTSPAATGGNNLAIPAEQLQPGAATPAPQSNSDVLDAASKADKRNNEVLNGLTKPDANMVKAISDGKYPGPNPYMMARADPHTKFLMAKITEYDPSYTDARFDSMKSFIAGPDALRAQNFNTAINHMGVLMKAGDALNQNELPVLNKIANAYGIQTGTAAPVVYDNIAHYVGSELRKLYANSSGGSLPELEQIVKGLDKAQSPEQRNGVMTSNIDLMSGAMDSLANKKRTAMGLAYDANPILSPSAQQTLADMHKSPEQRQAEQAEANIPVIPPDPNSPAYKNLPDNAPFKTIDGRILYKHAAPVQQQAPR